jgi:hypothetical protein
MASIAGLNSLGLPKFSANMPQEDAQTLYNYLYQLQEQLQYLLTNLDTDNLSEELKAQLGLT